MDFGNSRGYKFAPWIKKLIYGHGFYGKKALLQNIF